MNILFVDNQAQYGTSVNIVCDVMTGLLEMGIPSSLFCARADIFKKSLPGEVPIRTIKWDGYRAIATEYSDLKKRSALGVTQRRRMAKYEKIITPEFHKIIKGAGPDLVHFIGIDLSYLPFARYCEKKDLPFVVSVPEIREFSDLEGEVLWGASKIFVCSMAVKDYLCRRFPEVRYGNYETSLWPVSEVFFSWNNNEIQVSDSEAMRRAPLILTTAGDQMEKSWKNLLLAFEIVRKAIPEAKLKIICRPDSDTENQIFSTISKMGIKNSVEIILADVEKDPSVFFGADLFVRADDPIMPENGPVDGLAMDVARAMVMGIPAVVTDGGGGPGWIFGTGAGAIVPLSDHQKLATAIIAFLGNEKLLSQAKSAAKKRGKNAFTKKAIAQSLIAEYSQIIIPRHE